MRPGVYVIHTDAPHALSELLQLMHSIDLPGLRSQGINVNQIGPSNNGYLWSYGSGGGTFTSCDGVAGSDDFALNNVKTVFTGFIGSYFGDWNIESSFLRAPLGSGYCLTVIWDGRPHWWLHHMALGETM